MPKPGRYDLSGYAGDTYRLEITIEDDDGNALVLPSAGWAAQIRPKTSSTNPKAEFAIDTTDAATGVLVLALDAEQTARIPVVAVWDLQNSESGVTRTYLAGDVHFGREVTR